MGRRCLRLLPVRRRSALGAARAGRSIGATDYHSNNAAAWAWVLGIAGTLGRP